MATVFELAKGSSAITTLATNNGFDGFGGDFAVNADGTVYGISVYGTVFKLAKTSRTPLTLASCPEPGNAGNLVIDGAGNLYFGDGGELCELAKGSSTVKLLFHVNDLAKLCVNAGGNLYGTTDDNNGYGMVFELAKGSSTVTTMASFKGLYNISNLVIDGAGNLFGTVGYDLVSAGGTIFELAKGISKVTTLSVFHSGVDASVPASLVINSAGDLFGATESSGAESGTLFEIRRGSTAISTLYVFDSRVFGSSPYDLVINIAGNLYGTTSNAVFELPLREVAIGTELAAPEVTSASATETITATFTDSAGINLASIKAAGLSVSSAGNLFSVGTPLAVIGVSLSPDTGRPMSVTATYTVAAPGGKWAAADKGFYDGRNAKTE